MKDPSDGLNTRRIVIGYERLPTIKQRIPGSIAYLHPIHLMIRPLLLQQLRGVLLRANLPRWLL